MSAGGAGVGPPPPAVPGRRPPTSGLIEHIKRSNPLQVYNLIEQIGSGSYGYVYTAKRRDLRGDDREVAIKKMEVKDRNELNNLQNEIKLLKELRHGNIVEYYESYYYKCSLWLVMELCNCDSLQDIYHAKKDAFNEQQIAFVLRELLSAVCYIHSQHVMHRDIKGANILLTSVGNVKLADFGVSVQTSGTLDRTKTLIGTPYWMAPEMAAADNRKATYTNKCDIWACGIVAIELAHGEPPNFSQDPRHYLQRLNRSGYKPPKLDQSRPWSDNFHVLVKSLLSSASKRPTARDALSLAFVQQPGLGPALMLPFIKRRRKMSDVDDADDEDGMLVSEGAVAQRPARKESQDEAGGGKSHIRSGKVTPKGNSGNLYHVNPEPLRMKQKSAWDQSDDENREPNSENFNSESGESEVSSPPAPVYPDGDSVAPLASLDDTVKPSPHPANGAGPIQILDYDNTLRPASGGGRAPNSAAQQPEKPPRAHHDAPPHPGFQDRHHDYKYMNSPHPADPNNGVASHAVPPVPPVPTEKKEWKMPATPEVRMGALFTKVFDNIPFYCHCAVTWLHPIFKKEYILLASDSGVYSLDVEQVYSPEGEPELVLIYSSRTTWMKVHEGFLISISGTKKHYVCQHELLSLHAGQQTLRHALGKMASRLTGTGQKTYKIQATRGCLKCCMTKSFNDTVFMCTQQVDKFILFQWYECRFKELHCVRLEDPLDVPLSIMSLLHSDKTEYPYLCYDVTENPSNPNHFNVKTLHLDFQTQTLNTSVKLNLPPPLPKGRDIPRPKRVVCVRQLEKDTLLIAFPEYIRICNLEGKLKSPKKRAVRMDFNVTIKDIVHLDDSVLVFHDHGMVGRSFETQEETQNIGSSNNVYYRLLDSSGLIVVESCENKGASNETRHINLVVGHKQSGIN